MWCLARATAVVTYSGVAGGRRLSLLSVTQHNCIVRLDLISLSVRGIVSTFQAWESVERLFTDG